MSGTIQTEVNNGCVGKELCDGTFREHVSDNIPVRKMEKIIVNIQGCKSQGEQNLFKDFISIQMRNSW